MSALRDNAGKPELSFLLDLGRSLEALTKVFEQGAIKYARGNWKKGGKPDQEYLDSALRHLFKIGKGETYDVDTGCLHAAHVAWNVLALLELNVLGGLADLPVLDPEFDQAAFIAKYQKPVSIEDAWTAAKAVLREEVGPRPEVDQWAKFPKQDWPNGAPAGARARNVADL